MNYLQVVELLSNIFEYLEIIFINVYVFEIHISMYVRRTNVKGVGKKHEKNKKKKSKEYH